jgi:hypothetical protein
MIIIVIEPYWPRHIQIVSEIILEMRYAHAILVGKPGRQRPRENIIKLDVKEIE